MAVVTFPAPVCATGAAAGADPGAIVNANPLALAAAGETVEVLVPVDPAAASAWESISTSDAVAPETTETLLTCVIPDAVPATGTVELVACEA